MSVKGRYLVLLSLLLMSAVALHAQPSGCYNVVHHLRGGQGDVADTCVPSGTIFQLAVNSLPSVSRPGYDFLGWATSDVDSVTYPLGSTWNIVMNAQLDLYAVWHSNCVDYHDTIFQSACDSFYWAPTTTTYFSSDTLADTLFDAIPGECDSITHLFLRVAPSYHIVDTATTCNSYTWAVNGQTYSTTTTIDISYLSSDYCDSTHTLLLTVFPVYSQTAAISTCDSFYWSQTNVTYYTDTVVVRQLTSANGCDSLSILQLSVGSSFSISETVTTCDTFFWSHTGQTYTASTAINSHTLRSDGCDSSVYLDLTIYYSVHQLITPVVCDSFYWTATGSTYYNSTQTVVGGSDIHGCDSLRTLDLTVHHSRNSVVSEVVCDSVFWEPTMTYYYASQDIGYSLHTTEGCDSLVLLHLTVNHSYRRELWDSICPGSVYDFDGGSYYSTDDYIFRNATTLGCDSIVVLHLRVVEIPAINIQRDYDCNTGYYTIRASSPVPYYRWEATPSDPTLSNQASRSIVVVKPTQVTDYTLTVDYQPDFSFCPASEQLHLFPVTQPVARMDVTPDVLTVDHHYLHAIDRSTNSTRRAWYVNGEYWTGRPDLWYEASMDDDSVVILLVAVSETCDDSATHTLYVRHISLYAPNAFTPEEQNNRLFLVYGSGIVDFEMLIYNRGGNLVFSTTDMEEGWDGTDLNGNRCQQGVYVYKIKYTDQVMPRVPQTKSGSVLLIR